jgi:hypothetical protein
MTRSASRHRVGTWVTQYRPEVVYAYEVDGVRYSGSRDAMGGQTSSTFESLARRTAARYPEGLPVDVRYNPDNPAESTIDTRIPGIWILWLVPPLFLALAWLAAR